MSVPERVGLVLGDARDGVRGARGVSGARGGPVENGHRVDLDRGLTGRDEGLNQLGIGLLEGAADGAEVVDVHHDVEVDSEVARVGRGRLAVGGDRGGRHRLQLLADEHDAVAGHVERSGACRLHRVEDHKPDDRDDRHDAERDAAAHEHGVDGVTSLLLGARDSRCFASRFAALVLGESLLGHGETSRCRGGRDGVSLLGARSALPGRAAD